MRRQREKGNYWDKYKDFSLNFSSDKSDRNEFSSDQLSSNKDKDVIGINKRRGDIHDEGLENDKGGV